MKKLLFSAFILAATVLGGVSCSSSDDTDEGFKNTTLTEAQQKAEMDATAQALLSYITPSDQAALIDAIITFQGYANTESPQAASVGSRYTPAAFAYIMNLVGNIAKSYDATKLLSLSTRADALDAVSLDAFAGIYTVVDGHFEKTGDATRRIEYRFASSRGTGLSHIATLDYSASTFAVQVSEGTVVNVPTELTLNLTANNVNQLSLTVKPSLGSVYGPISVGASATLYGGYTITAALYAETRGGYATALLSKNNTGLVEARIGLDADEGFANLQDWIAGKKGMTELIRACSFNINILNRVAVIYTATDVQKILSAIDEWQNSASLLSETQKLCDAINSSASGYIYFPARKEIAAALIFVPDPDAGEDNCTVALVSPIDGTQTPVKEYFTDMEAFAGTFQSIMTLYAQYQQIINGTQAQ